MTWLGTLAPVTAAAGGLDWPEIVYSGVVGSPTNLQITDPRITNQFMANTINDAVQAVGLNNTAFLNGLNYGETGQLLTMLFNNNQTVGRAGGNIYYELEATRIAESLINLAERPAVTQTYRFPEFTLGQVQAGASGVGTAGLALLNAFLATLPAPTAVGVAPSPAVESSHIQAGIPGRVGVLVEYPTVTTVQGPMPAEDVNNPVTLLGATLAAAPPLFGSGTTGNALNFGNAMFPVHSATANARLFIPREYLVSAVPAIPHVGTFTITLGGNAGFVLTPLMSGTPATDRSYGVSFGGVVDVGTHRIMVESNQLTIFAAEGASASDPFGLVADAAISGIAVPLRITARNFDAPITLTIGSSNTALNRTITLGRATADVHGIVTPNFPTGAVNVPRWQESTPIALNLTETQANSLTIVQTSGTPQTAAREGLRGLTLTIGQLGGAHRFGDADPTIVFGGFTLPIFESHEAALAANIGIQMIDPLGTGDRWTRDADYTGDPVVADGIIRNLAPISTSTNTVSYAFFSHNRTRLNIVFEAHQAQPAGSFNVLGVPRTINITGLTFRHSNPAVPVFANDVPLTIGSNIGAGNSYGNNIAGGATATINAANFVTDSFDIVPATVSNNAPTHANQTVIAGRLPEAVIGTRGQVGPIGFTGNTDFVAGPAGLNTSTIRLTQPVLGLVNPLVGGVTFTLVDAAGVPLTGVSMRGVALTNAPIPAANAAPDVFFANEVGASTVREGFNMIWSPGGNGLTVTGVSSAAQHLNVRFAIVADVNFSGTVYLAVTGGLIDEHLGANNRLPIATVRTGLTATVETTQVDVGFQTTVLSRIVIAETNTNDIPTQTVAESITITLDPVWGAGQLLFAPINAAMAQTLVTTTEGILASVRPNASASSEVIIDISRGFIGGEAPGSITIDGLRIIENMGTVPAAVYGAFVTGNLITNVDALEINTNTAVTPNVVLNQGQNGFRRWGHGSLRIENVLRVGIVDVYGDVHERAPIVAIIPFQPGSTITLDGNPHVLRNFAGQPISTDNRVIDGTSRLLLPMRAMVEIFGGDVADLGVDENGVRRILTIIPGAPREEVVWFMGRSAVDVHGFANWPIPVAPFVDNVAGTQWYGSTLVPLASFAPAHGIELEVGTNAGTFTLNFTTN
jgi:hypothetical protein